MNKEILSRTGDLMKYAGAVLMFAGLILMAFGLMGLCMELLSFEVGAALLTVSALAGWLGAECIDYIESQDD